MKINDSRYFLYHNYPENLIRTVCLDEDMEINDDRLLGLNEAGEMLLEREKDVLKMRFRERLAFSEIANRTNVPAKTIRRVYNRSIRKLRQSDRIDLIKLGLKAAEEERKSSIEAEISSDRAAFQRALKKAGNPDLELMTVQDMRMSPRVTNALLRGHIETLGDLWITMQRHPEEYDRLHGIGEKAKEEIHSRLMELGFTGE